jgi:hypothetical protein
MKAVIHHPSGWIRGFLRVGLVLACIAAVGVLGISAILVVEASRPSDYEYNTLDISTFISAAFLAQSRPMSQRQSGFAQSLKESVSILASGGVDGADPRKVALLRAPRVARPPRRR